mgnify:CR=1 FL=1
MELEDKVKLTKYLHKKHNLQEIEEFLHVDTRTRQRYIREIKEDNTVSFLNVKYPLYIKKSAGRIVGDSDGSDNEIPFESEEYKSTVHPVFLPLNMTEVYALTTHLMKISSVEDKEMYREIAEKIYSQLSDYAIDRLGNNPYHLEKRETVEFISENEMYERDHISKLLTALKAGCRVKITFQDGRIETGKVRMGEGTQMNLEVNNEYHIPIAKDNITYIEILYP